MYSVLLRGKSSCLCCMHHSLPPAHDGIRHIRKSHFCSDLFSVGMPDQLACQDAYHGYIPSYDLVLDKGWSQKVHAGTLVTGESRLVVAPLDEMHVCGGRVCMPVDLFKFHNF